MPTTVTQGSVRWAVATPVTTPRAREPLTLTTVVPHGYAVPALARMVLSTR